MMLDFFECDISLVEFKCVFLLISIWCKMANRPVYEVLACGEHYVKVHNVDFRWYSGYSILQKKKCIESLHASFISLTGCRDILEISSKSSNHIGISLSAFNLGMVTKKTKIKISVESAFQGSKKFSLGGPFQDLYYVPSIKAKKDARLKSSGELLSFDFFGESWPTEPKTLFYDWIYINALHKDEYLKNEILKFSAFTDIEFNPSKSINCQAHSAALYVSLVRRGVIEDVISSKSKYLELNGIVSDLKYKKSKVVKSRALFLPFFDDKRGSSEVVS